jgi:hypothetical protein
MSELPRKFSLISLLHSSLCRDRLLITILVVINLKRFIYSENPCLDQIDNGIIVPVANTEVILAELMGYSDFDSPSEL